ncbi:protein of unknown function DUF58 [Halothece sp. PCC 7418]|uniref:DUF58 domain-containing protein n=1 Tax=Halothece sp. (strain PCC 7418) TaxID=65093 RepID=UPI0002A088AB|nr:DUF58 domain-containing protein [Halothece sp. PCC 7418]AFZ43925.1 protein of unknown function DUF58 [Halothece sp. PCC 7418]
MLHRLQSWLENHASSPSYGGLVLLLIAIAFFGAATNTMVGWLYALSGLIFALLGLAAVLPPRALKPLQVRRSPIYPVSAGDELTLELIIDNPTPQSKTLLQVIDQLPSALGKPPQRAIEVIPPKESYDWIYTTEAKQRGIYHWSQVHLRTATPLGLFWSRRSRQVKSKAIVYPLVLPLKQCSLLDTIGEEDSDQFPQERRFQAATIGLTRGLRPYRRGDSPRLIHWRSSARYGELRVRELELSMGGQDVVICLNSAIAWEEQLFEDAVIAAASLYFYALRSQLNVKLWTAQAGLIQSQQEVLEVLAAVQFQETHQQSPPSLPLVWLTCDPTEVKDLPQGSRWVYFSPEETDTPLASNFLGLTINTAESLQQQLQKSPERR